VVPSADHYVPRPISVPATQRTVAAFATLGVPIQLVTDTDLRGRLEGRRLIVLPANTGLPDGAWQAIVEAVEGGATLLTSGWFEQDDAGLPAYRLGADPRMLGVVERLDAPWLEPQDPLRYPLDVAQSAYAAAGEAAITGSGAGQVISYPVPLEWAVGPRVLETVYTHALTMAEVTRPPVRPHEPEPGVLVSVTAFRGAALVVLMNEQGRDREVVLTMPGGTVLRVPVRAGAGQMLWISKEGAVLDSLDPDIR